MSEPGVRWNQPHLFQEMERLNGNRVSFPESEGVNTSLPLLGRAPGRECFALSAAFCGKGRRDDGKEKAVLFPVTARVADGHYMKPLGCGYGKPAWSVS
jgi:hypothetical protein